MTGLTRDTLERDGKPLSDVLNGFVSFLNSISTTTGNTQFTIISWGSNDTNVLNDAFASCGMSPLHLLGFNINILNAMIVFKVPSAYFGTSIVMPQPTSIGGKGYSQSSVCEAAGVSAGCHRAGSDVAALIKLIGKFPNFHYIGNLLTESAKQVFDIDGECQSKILFAPLFELLGIGKSGTKRGLIHQLKELMSKETSLYDILLECASLNADSDESIESNDFVANVDGSLDSHIDSLVSASPTNVVDTHVTQSMIVDSNRSDTNDVPSLHFEIDTLKRALIKSEDLLKETLKELQMSKSEVARISTNDIDSPSAKRSCPNVRIPADDKLHRINIDGNSPDVKFHDVHGHCAVVFVQQHDTSHHQDDMLRVGDVIIKLQGIKLSEVDGGKDTWDKLYMSFSAVGTTALVYRCSH